MSIFYHPYHQHTTPWLILLSMRCVLSMFGDYCGTRSFLSRARHITNNTLQYGTDAVPPFWLSLRTRSITDTRPITPGQCKYMYYENQSNNIMPVTTVFPHHTSSTPHHTTAYCDTYMIIATPHRTTPHHMEHHIWSSPYHQQQMQQRIAADGWGMRQQSQQQ